MKLSSILFALAAICGAGCGVPNTTSGSGGGTGGILTGGTQPGNTGTAATSLTNNPLSSVCQTRGGTLYFGSNGGKLLVSTDGTTVKVLDGTARNISGAFCEQSSTTVTNVWFVGTAGLILKYDGTTLTQQTSNTTANLKSVFGANANTVFAVGDGGVISTLNGNAWTPQSSGTTQNLFGVAGSDATHFYAVGANRKILVLTFPSTWGIVSDSALPADVPSDTIFYGAWADPVSGDVFVVGKGGKILRGTSFGTTWTQLASGTVEDLFSVFGTSTTNVRAVGKGGTILLFNGTTWAKQTVPTGTENFGLDGVFANSSTSAFAVGANGTTATSTGLLLKLASSAWVQVL